MSGIVSYIPLVTPLPVWDYWVWLILPLSGGVSVVYKTIKCRYVRQIPWEAFVLTIWILLSMIGVAAGIFVVYKIFLAM